MADGTPQLLSASSSTSRQSLTQLQVPQLPPPPVPTSPSPEWSSDSVPLKDLAAKDQVPGFAKVVKGNYMTLGTSKFSFQKQHQEVFVHSVKVGVKVLAHCLRRVDATAMTKRGSQYNYTRVYAVDQRLAIPISYQGWFELLSEDGKSARPITSVHELSKVKPDKALVRENIKAYTVNGEGKLTFDKTKIILAGEQLVLCGEISLPSPVENKKVKLLRCFDSKGEHVCLSFDQKGVFTPIAGDKDFTGVFSVTSIVKRFRLPITVKLIQGVRPRVDPTKFSGLIRLDWVYSDETAFICPIEKNHVRLLPVPTDTALHLVGAVNQQAMKSTELYRAMFVKCSRMIANYNNTLHLIVQMPDAAAKVKGRIDANVFSLPFESDAATPTRGRSKKKEDKLMDEIDNLYGYVRDGGAPPKFAYDSDEESYWEEPAYEPLDEFRARLKAIEAGEPVKHHDKYMPREPFQLNFSSLADKESKHDLRSPNGTFINAELPVADSGKSQPPPLLPPRRPSLDESPLSGSPIESTATSLDNYQVQPPKSKPPPMPPRRHSAGYTVVANMGLVSSNQNPTTTSPHKGSNQSTRFLSSAKIKADSRNNKRLSTPNLGSHDSSSASGSSGQGYGAHLARDFKDSDISSVTRGSSNSSGPRMSNARKKMQTLYL